VVGGRRRVALTGNFGRLFGIRAAFGLAQAPAYPVLSQVTRNWFPQRYRTSMQGVMTPWAASAAPARP